MTASIAAFPIIPTRPEGSRQHLHGVPIHDPVRSTHLLAGELRRRPPDPRALEVSGEVVVDGAGDVEDGRTLGHSHRLGAGDAVTTQVDPDESGLLPDTLLE